MSTPAFTLWSPSQQTMGKEATASRAVNIVRPGTNSVVSPSAHSNSSASSYFPASSALSPPVVSPSPGHHKPRVTNAAQIDSTEGAVRLAQSHSTSSSSSTSTNASNHSYFSTYSSQSNHKRVAPTIYNSSTINSAFNIHKREGERQRSNSLLSRTASQRSDDGFHSDSSDRQSDESASFLNNSNGSRHSILDGASLSPLTPNYNRASVIGAADDRVKLGPQRPETLGNDIPNKVVAKIKSGTILNGKGELVTMGSGSTTHDSQDGARVNRKIADLELQNASLLAVIKRLEDEKKTQKQAGGSMDIKKQMSSGDDPNDEVTDLTEEDIDSDTIFKRICLTMDGLINEAKTAIAYQPTSSGKVLSQYNNGSAAGTNPVSFKLTPDEYDAADESSKDDDDDERLSTTSSVDSGTVTPRQATTPIPFSKSATSKATTASKSTQPVKIVVTKPRSTSTVRKAPLPHKTGLLS
ncbi:hypothetical protein BC936DRAFT_142000 [Jimgerdemannia flammicorona]|uniref:Uncharacterized protein n=1 Tax=Jimgerdemannia flammicorona TaxID=994334 RepID=A0A433DFL6_9FUNG|nr:hypothetical protein BC936DRAFT_142000 [Jimgerdemannia flammicorona]